MSLSILDQGIPIDDISMTFHEGIIVTNRKRIMPFPIPAIRLWMARGPTEMPISVDL
jgi:hypothetical protein